MTVRKPLVQVGGTVQEVPAGDTLLAATNPNMPRQLSYSNGGCGAYTVSSVTTTGMSIRIPIRLPAGMTQWRVKLRIYDTKNSTTKTAVTGKKIIYGTQSVSLSGAAAETGSFAGSTATTLVGSDFTINGDGSFYTSGWTSDAADFVGIALTASGSQSWPLGIGRCWYWSNITSGVDPTVAGSAATSTAQWIPIDVEIEFQVTSRQKAGLWIGDSISEGTGATKGAAVSPVSWWRAYPRQWADAAGVLLQSHALYNTFARDWASSSYNLWTRQDTSLGAFDFAVVALGSNDAADTTSRTLAQYQADLMSVVANAQAIIGSGKPVYVLNVLARSLDTAHEAARVSYNDWLAQRPSGIAAVVDVDTAMRNSSASVLDSALCSSDLCHPSWQGSQVLAQVLRSAIPV